MSVDATIATWKLDKSITAIQKLLLLSLADRAGENAECWPGLKRLMKDTNLDRHTIIDNRKLLIDKGLIEFTGELKGRTKSIPVMRLTYVKSREDEYDENQEFISSVESNTTSSVESNTAKQCGNAHLEPKREEPKIEPKIISESSDSLPPKIKALRQRNKNLQEFINIWNEIAQNTGNPKQGKEKRSLSEIRRNLEVIKENWIIPLTPENFRTWLDNAIINEFYMLTKPGYLKSMAIITRWNHFEEAFNLK